MHYEGSIYRPPSEAHSLILQVTVGCTHNGCAFCEMYNGKQFHIKPFEIILSDLHEARMLYPHVERIFFADGDALCMATDKLLKLLYTVREIFPECSRVGIYSRPSQLLTKSEDELVSLKHAGLGIAYIGAESGSDEVLLRVNKGETSNDIVKAVIKSEKCAIATSVTFILGLGGRDLMVEHATKTGEMISAIGATYVGLLSLMLTPGTELYADARSGAFIPLTATETLKELELILQNTNCLKETILRSNHASNWLTLAGVLPRDKEQMLRQVRTAMQDPRLLRADEYRRL